MRFLAPIALLVAPAACGPPPHAAAPVTPAPKPAAAPAPPAAPAAPAAAATPAAASTPAPGDTPIAPEQTAGLYWQPYTTCDDCANPAAVVAYVTPNAAVARQIVAALDGKLPLGRPYVVYSDELGVKPRGIAVVTGAYGSLAAAQAAAARLPAIAGQQAVAHAVAAAADDAYDQDGARYVTVVDRGPPVPAWSQADFEAVKAARDASNDPAAQESEVAERSWLFAHLRARRPLCAVHPGDLFVVTFAQIDWYEAAPVRCGQALAYIPWTSSLLGHAAIVPDGGGHRLFQVVGAECDSPIVCGWRYDAEGRHADPPTPGARADPACAP